MIKYKPEIREDGEGRVERDYQEPSDEVVEAFEEFYQSYTKSGDITSIGELNKASQILEDLDVSINELNDLPLIYPEKSSKSLGTFLSAGYNLSEEDVIVYSSEASCRPAVGSHLDSDKTLILDSPTRNAGDYSKGIIINLSSAYNTFGAHNEGLCINASLMKGYFVQWNPGLAVNLGGIKEGYIPPKEDGIFLNFRKIDSSLLLPRYMYYASTRNKFLTNSFIEGKAKSEGDMDYIESCQDFLTSQDIRNSELSDYLDQLETRMRDYINQIPESLSEPDFNQEKIEQKIDELLGDSN